MHEKATGGSTFDYPVIAVGASAGGIEALKTMVERIPAETRAAFIVLQHLAPDHESQLVNILSRAAHLPCLEAAEGMRVHSGHIYVSPPNRYLSIVDHELFMEPPHEARGSRMPIDYFMRSLAETAGSQAVGVLLSGTGSDGALGMRAIRGAGGITFVQSPETAQYDGMPRAAIDSGVADEVGTISSICASVAQLARDSAKGPAEVFTRRDLGPILALLKARMNFDFSSYKVGTISRRVKRRMSLLHANTLREYSEILRNNSNEVSQLFDDMLINVTTFFRDPHVWEELRHKVINSLVSSANNVPIRIWVPACSTGEEAYTIAMLMDESCQAYSAQCDWQIFATDLDGTAISRAREAIYPPSISVDISKDRLRQYFRKEMNGFRVKKQLRERVIFARQDILSDPPFSRLDLVSCRNLLIYLNADRQNQLIDTFQFALKDHGYLVLGTSETVASRSRDFKTISGKAHIYRRKPGIAATQFAMKPEGASKVSKPRTNGRLSKSKRPPDLTENVRQSLLERFAPASIVISSSGNMLHYTGAVQRFIDTPEGEPKTNIYQVTPAGLRVRIRELVKHAQNGRQSDPAPIQVRFPDRDQAIKVDCVSLETDSENPQYLITFLEVEQPRQQPANEGSGDDQDYAKDLEAELEIVREDLHTTIEKLETSNEGLKRIHEEALAANEELQSANEELETSGEELQSLNEELVTVNNQLEEKIGEVQKTTDDLRNLIASTKLPALFLDSDLHISNYTETVRSLIEIRESDIGRPLKELAFKIDDESLTDDARRVLEALQPMEAEVAGPDDTNFLRRIQPYRTGDERISGVVVTFTDITVQAKTAIRLAARERQARIISELGQSALAQRDQAKFMEDAIILLRQAMNCNYSKILELAEDQKTLRLVAGSGWNRGVVGKIELENGRQSQAGYTLQVENSVLVSDLDSEVRFDGPALLTDHAVRSGISTVIFVGGKPWGVIGLHDRDAGHFSEEDLDILRIAADIIALAIMQSWREEHLARERLSLSLALTVADLGVWVYDIETGAVTWDESLREMTGLRQSFAKPKLNDFVQYIHEDDRQDVSEGFTHTIVTGEPFETEFRFIKPNGDIMWLMGKGERLIQQGKPIMIGVNSDVTERRINEEQKSFMMRELDHRVKNLFAVILAIAELTSRSAANLDEFRGSFASRLHAMARTHTTLAESRWIGADLKMLLEEEIVGHGQTGQVKLSGPKIAITPICAQALSMLFHELMTNAVKYGALSAIKGVVKIRWFLKKEHPTVLNLEWEETGGPIVTAPSSAGFGSKVMERIVTDQLSAKVTTEWRETGLRFQMSFDIAPFRPGATRPAKIVRQTSMPSRDILQEKSILVIDDEWLIAEQHADVLTTMGAKVIGPFIKLEDALEADLTQVDAALLDFALEDGNSLPLAEKIREAGKPFAFVSGYGSAMNLPSPFEAYPIITKPANAAAILDGTARLLRQNGSE